VKHTAVLLFLVAPALVLAGAGAAFLKIPVGPRVCGTGEAAVAYIDDASALYYNPAGLANVPSFDVLLAHNQGFLDMNQEYVAGVYGSEGLGRFGLAFDYWGSGSIQGINIRGESIPGYVFSAADWSLNLGYARSFSDLSVGLGLELVHDQQESLSTSAIAFNAGAMYKTPLKDSRPVPRSPTSGPRGRSTKRATACPWKAVWAGATTEASSASCRTSSSPRPRSPASPPALSAVRSSSSHSGSDIGPVLTWTGSQACAPAWASLGMASAWTTPLPHTASWAPPTASRSPTAARQQRPRPTRNSARGRQPRVTSPRLVRKVVLTE